MAYRTDKITIHDIARKASVSAGTVDRVIHNRVGVSERTRSGVLKLIRQLDYQPDILARALASRKPIKIAAIYPGLKSGKPFWSIPEKGMDKAVDELDHFGVQLFKFPYNQADPITFQRQAKKILKYGFDGILLAPGGLKESTWLAKNCNDLKIPCVIINSLFKFEPYLSFIGQDSYASGTVAARLMDDCIGQVDHVAVINIEQDPEKQDHIRDREKGFINYSVENLGRARKNILSYTIAKSTDASIHIKLKKIFVSHKIEGVFITNSRAYFIAQWLRSNTKYNPVIIGYDLIAENRMLLNEGKIRFLISQNPEEQGYRGVMTLFNHLVLKRNVPKNQFLPIDIITAENMQYYHP